MDRIIFFDIDKTLFDREKYLGDFFKLLESEYGLDKSEVDEAGDFYREIKEEYGYFSSEAFLARIYKKYPALSEKLDYYFSSENLDSFLFEDCKVLYELKNARLGIFSKGDTVLQKAKIKKLEDIIEPNLIYIYHDKLEELPEFLNKHSDCEIVLVDDNIAVLISAKDLDENVKTILIDRANEYEKVNNIDFKINSLFDIIQLLNE